jgi:hypothetical protein
MLCAEGVALILYMDEFHPDDLETILELMLIEVELDFCLPFYELSLSLLLCLLQGLDLSPDGLVFGLEVDDSKD